MALLAVESQLDRVKVHCGLGGTRGDVAVVQECAIVVGIVSVAVVEEVSLLCRVGVARVGAGVHVLVPADRHDERRHRMQERQIEINRGLAQGDDPVLVLPQLQKANVLLVHQRRCLWTGYVHIMTAQLSSPTLHCRTTSPQVRDCSDAHPRR